MPIRLVAFYSLLPNPVGHCTPEAQHITPEGIRIDPDMPSLCAGQGNDPPSGGSGGHRPLLETLHGAQAPSLYDSPISTQLQERIQFRVAQLARLLGGGGDYALPDEFDQGFNLSVEIQALLRVVDANWGNEEITKAVGSRAWHIRRKALNAYGALHSEVVEIRLEEQRTALGCLRNWFYMEEEGLAGTAQTAYESLLTHVVEINASERKLVQDLLEKEQHALEDSLEDHTDESDGRKRDTHALGFVRDLTLKIIEP